MVKSTSKECGKGAGESDGTPSCSAPHGHAHHILFSNKALNMASRKCLAVVKGVSGVLGVTIQGNNTFTWTAKLDKTIGISFTNSNLQQNKGVVRNTLSLFPALETLPDTWNKFIFNFHELSWIGSEQNKPVMGHRNIWQELQSNRPVPNYLRPLSNFCSHTN